MTTSESKGRLFFLQNESILVANWNALVVATGRRAIDVSWRSEEE